MINAIDNWRIDRHPFRGIAAASWLVRSYKESREFSQPSSEKTFYSKREGIGSTDLWGVSYRRTLLLHCMVCTSSWSWWRWRHISCQENSSGSNPSSWSLVHCRPTMPWFLDCSHHWHRSRHPKRHLRSVHEIWKHPVRKRVRSSSSI